MKRRPVSRSDERAICTLYPSTPTAQIARQFKRDINLIYRIAHRNGVCKTDEYLASPEACRLRRGDNVGAAHRFTKGHVPVNKGQRRPGWAPGRMAETQFKKGQRSSNFLPIGSERINGDGYRDRKISATGYPPRDWRGVHILLWESKHGRLKKGFAVVFKNGDKTDLRLENLECISRRDLMLRNSFHNRYPKNIGRLIQLRGALNRQINKRTSNEEQDRRSA